MKKLSVQSVIIVFLEVIDVPFDEIMMERHLDCPKYEIGRMTGEAIFTLVFGVAISKVTLAAKKAIVRTTSWFKSMAGKGTIDGIPRGSLSNEAARRWYLDQEARIPSMIDTRLPLKQQAKQVFNLRNKFRTQARELMSDRIEANHLNATKPNQTWDQVVNKYSRRGFSGDALWREIINASTRSNSVVNESLGVFP